MTPACVLIAAPTPPPRPGSRPWRTPISPPLTATQEAWPTPPWPGVRRGHGRGVAAEGHVAAPGSTPRRWSSPPTTASGLFVDLAATITAPGANVVGARVFTSARARRWTCSRCRTPPARPSAARTPSVLRQGWPRPWRRPAAARPRQFEPRRAADSRPGRGLLDRPDGDAWTTRPRRVSTVVEASGATGRACWWPRWRAPSPTPA